MSSSSSSEEDEESRRIKEATSEELIKHMQTKQERKSKDPSPRKNAHKKSLRNGSESENSAQYDLVTTPEFRAHVAKKLSSYLDRVYDTRAEDEHVTCAPTAGNLEGIKLLRSSRIHLLTDASVHTESPKARRRARDVHSSNSSSDEEEERKKFASVCISGSNILSHGEGAFKRVQETKHKPPVSPQDSEIQETPSKKRKAEGSSKNSKPRKQKDPTSFRETDCLVSEMKGMPRKKKKKCKDNG